MLKLFVWEGIGEASNGLAVVLANDEAEARKVMIEQIDGGVSDTLPFADVLIVTEPSAFYSTGGW